MWTAKHSYLFLTGYLTFLFAGVGNVQCKILALCEMQGALQVTVEGEGFARSG